MSYIIYPLKKYWSTGETEDYKTKVEHYNTRKEIARMLKEDKGYHFRIEKDKRYIFFGDCDNPKYTIDEIINNLIAFLGSPHYNIAINREDILYTENANKKRKNSDLIGRSYHYSIPKLNASCEKLKIIHEHFNRCYDGIVDTVVYSDHWFRCPNQTKVYGADDKHTIVAGKMRDFIVDYIPEDSRNIDDLIKSDIIIPKARRARRGDHLDDTQLNDTDPKNIIKMDLIRGHWKVVKMLIDQCFSDERSTDFEYWINVGLAIECQYGVCGFELFKYFSNKSDEPDTEEDLLKTYYSFHSEDRVGSLRTIRTIFYYAEQDDKETYEEIVKNHFYISDFDVVKYTQLLQPNIFRFKNGILYYQVKLKWYPGLTKLHMYVSNDLYDFLLNLIKENRHIFDNPYIKKLGQLKKQSFLDKIDLEKFAFEDKKDGPKDIAMAKKIVEWINNEVVGTDVVSDKIQVFTIFTRFKYCDLYSALSKREKDRYNKGFFIRAIKDDPIMKEFFSTDVIKKGDTYLMRHAFRNPDFVKPDDKVTFAD